MLKYVIWRHFCYVAFPVIYFFDDSVIISKEDLKQSTCQEDCVISQHLLQPFMITSSLCWFEKNWRGCLFEENHCSPVLLKVPIYSTELCSICLKRTALNLQKHLKRPHSFMVNQHRKNTFIFSNILKHSAESQG